MTAKMPFGDQRSSQIAEAIRELYALTSRLAALYPGRHFTPDGHLVGSLGEVYAAEHYGIKLFTASTKAHDGEASDGRLVQIKATQRNSVALSHKPDYLIVLKINESSEFSEVFNGPGDLVWNLFKGRKRQSNGQYQISLAKLRELDKLVELHERIQAH